MSGLGAITSLLVVLTASAARAQDAAPPAPCGGADASALFAAVPAAEREGFWIGAAPEDAELGSTGRDAAPRVALIDLDGVAPAEALLGLDAIRTDLSPGQSAVWVLACRDGSWRALGRVLFDVDAGWDGTYDDVPGIATLRGEMIAGVGHDLARIEHVDVRGGADPRFVRRRFVLAHVVDGALVVALDYVVRDTVEAGPDRAEVFRARRTLVLQRDAQPRYRLTIRTSSARRAFSCGATLTFDGRRFVPDDEACARR